jgi:UDP-glucose 4-epimerase
MARKKVLLTGATGLVGSMIANTLCRFVDLTQISRVINSQNTISNNLPYLDLMNKIEVKSFISRLRPDFVIHCAAQIPSNLNPDSPELAAVNSNIDENIISAIANAKSQLIYMSSTSVYGNPNYELNIDENFPLNPVSYYSAQKIKAEKQISDNIENYLIFRLNAPYGLNMRVETVMNLFIKNAFRNENILLYGSGSRMQDFTNSRDIADFIYNLISIVKRYQGIYNISFGQPLSMFELANKIIKICSSKSVISYLDIVDKQEHYKASFSIDKAKFELNWNPQITLENGIREITLNNIDN